MMGRDYDCKYVVSRSWAAFLATLADDMATDKWFIDDDTKELKLKEFKQPGVEPAYIDILRWRTDQKYGRKGPKKRPLRINSQVAGSQQSNGYSPYGSPVSASGEDRGRSPHRFQNGKQPAVVAASSPRAHLSSPLARVTEEAPSQPQPLKLDTTQQAYGEVTRPEKLVSVDTPRSYNAHKLERLVSVDNTPVDSVNGGFGDERRGSLPRSSNLKHSMLSETTTAVAKEGPDVRAEEAAAKAGAEEGEMRDVRL